MTAGRTNCDPEQLAVLIDGDEHSPAFRMAAVHIDSCILCQQRITDLAAETAYWSTQREMLTPLDGDDQDSDYLSRYRSPDRLRAGLDERTVRDLLDPPSHPEMLGRLGRYEIERVIGSGGMGIVLKGFDTELHRPVAIKMLAPHLARIGAARQRFAREARAAAAVVHEHVVAIHDVQSEAAAPYLVMPFIAGESLQARVDREGPLRVFEILRIGVQAASGLAAAHAQGLIHRDVKPANILLENGVERAYLTDFGLARASDDASLTTSGIVAGTPHYMSPEQASGQPLDARSDLFSLGSVLYFMATGHPPFRAEHPMAVLKRTCHDRHRPVGQLNREIPGAVARIIDRLLEKQPGRRFASASDLATALSQALLDVQQGHHVRTGGLRWKGLRGWPASGLVGATLILVALGIWLLFGFPRTTPGDGGASADRPTQSTPAERLPQVAPAGQLPPSTPAAAAPAEGPQNWMAIDPSPPGPSWSELDALDRQLRALETMPFPETSFPSFSPIQEP